MNQYDAKIEMFQAALKNMHEALDALVKERAEQQKPVATDWWDDERAYFAPVAGTRRGRTPIIYRYFRNMDVTQDGQVVPDNLSGVTFAFVIDYERSIVEVGVSMCSDDENFDKSIGRMVAQDRLRTQTVTFDFVEGKDSLVKQFYAALRAAHDSGAVGFPEFLKQLHARMLVENSIRAQFGERCKQFGIGVNIPDEFQPL